MPELLVLSHAQAISSRQQAGHWNWTRSRSKQSLHGLRSIFASALHSQGFRRSCFSPWVEILRRESSVTVSQVGLIRDSRPTTLGSCQFPTLGFVVDRYFRVQNFVPEKYWSIKVAHRRNGQEVSFAWDRVHLFDRMAVTILFERCLTARLARVTDMKTRPTSKWKPLPLTTVELQKLGSMFLRLDSQRVMKVLAPIR